jgi:hypothetical protein
MPPDDWRTAFRPLCGLRPSGRLAAVQAKKVKSRNLLSPFAGTTMSSPADRSTNAAHSSPTPAQEQDAVEAIVPLMPIVLPVAGGVLMFLLAFIAIYMA